MNVLLLTDGRVFEDDEAHRPYAVGDVAWFDEDILLVVKVHDRQADAIPHPKAEEMMRAALYFVPDQAGRAGHPGPDRVRAGFDEAMRIHDTLKLRVWTCGDEEWVIAWSAEDAALVYAETGADPIEDVPWTPCPDDKPFTYRDEDEDGNERRTCKTMAEHAMERGRGYFGTANY